MLGVGMRTNMGIASGHLLSIMPLSIPGVNFIEHPLIVCIKSCLLKDMVKG